MEHHDFITCLPKTFAFNIQSNYETDIENHILCRELLGKFQAK